MKVNNMAESAEQIIQFMLELPGNIEQARRSTFSSNINALELWHIRTQNSLNLLNLLCERSQSLQLNTFLFCNLELLKHEVKQVYERIDMFLYSADYRHTTEVYTQVNNQESEEQSTSFGRPREVISKEDIETQFGIFRNWKLVAHQLGISTKTLHRRRVEFGMEISRKVGARVTYTNISHVELCTVVRSVLDTLPDTGETMIIGALRKRGIYVQRSRGREAILEVDPINRALRRTVAIIRRTYNVASPNSLW